MLKHHLFLLSRNTQLQTSKLFFARDPIGRRSLLVGWPSPQHPSLLITSAACPESLKDGKGFEELSCEGVWTVDLQVSFEASLSCSVASPLNEHILSLLSIQNLSEGPTKLERISNVRVRTGFESPSIPTWFWLSLSFLSCFWFSPAYISLRASRVQRSGMHCDCFSAHFTRTRSSYSRFSEGLTRKCFSESHSNRFISPKVSSDFFGVGILIIQSLFWPASPLFFFFFFSSEPRTAILFSGGLDCSSLALLSHQFVPPSQPIDLLNVAFENPRALGAFKKVPNGENSIASEPQLASSKYDVPDRLTGLRTWEELKSLVPERKWNFIEVNVPYDEFLQEKENIEALMHPCDSVVSNFCVWPLTDPNWSPFLCFSFPILLVFWFSLRILQDGPEYCCCSLVRIERYWLHSWRWWSTVSNSSSCSAERVGRRWASRWLCSSQGSFWKSWYTSSCQRSELSLSSHFHLASLLLWRLLSPRST